MALQWDAGDGTNLSVFDKSENNFPQYVGVLLQEQLFWGCICSSGKISTKVWE